MSFPSSLSKAFFERDMPLAYVLLRLTMGFHMLAHGAVRLDILDEFARGTALDFASTRVLNMLPFPEWLVYPVAYVIPPVEFLIGVLLILGLKTRLAGVIGAVLMLVMMFGVVAQKNFGTAHIMWFYVFAFCALVALNVFDRWGLDDYLKRKK